MASYDYGNTRLRARISRLFSIETLENYSDLTAIDSLISALSKSHYKESIEYALTYSNGYTCITEAMKQELKMVMQDINEFYDGVIQERISTVFMRNDLYNIKAIFRGLIHDMSLDDIMDAISPLGTIPDSVLNELAKSKNAQEAISKTSVFKLPFADTLLELNARETPLKSSETETALEKWYFDRIGSLLSSRSTESKILKEYNAIEADIVNLNTVLRIVAAPDVVNGLFTTHIEERLIHRGNIAFAEWMDFTSMTIVEDVIKELKHTKYFSFLLKGLECYKDTKRLSEFENQMRMYALTWQAKLPRRFPLGFGVPIGYIALKKSEVRNLRWIAKGIESGFEHSYIKENLEQIE